GVFALGILAHDEEVDVAGLAAGERTGDAGHQAHRAQVDVLIELTAPQHQRTPQRHMIRHLRRPADRAEEDRVIGADPALPVLRHHAAVLLVIFDIGEVEPVELERKTVLLGRLLQRPDPLRHHLLADPVARDDGNAVSLAHVGLLAVGGVLISDEPRRRKGATVMPTTSAMIEAHLTPALLESGYERVSGSYGG